MRWWEMDRWKDRWIDHVIHKCRNHAIYSPWKKNIIFPGRMDVALYSSIKLSIHPFIFIITIHHPSIHIHTRTSYIHTYISTYIHVHLHNYIIHTRLIHSFIAHIHTYTMYVHSSIHHSVTYPFINLSHSLIYSSSGIWYTQYLKHGRSTFPYLMKNKKKKFVEQNWDEKYLNGFPTINHLQQKI